MNRVTVDLHLHSTASDGSDSVEELFGQIKSKGIRVFALTDHDTVDGIEQMEALAARDPERIFIPGIEFSCHTGIRKTHILGLGIDYRNPQILELIEEGRANRKLKFENRLKWLREQHGILLAPDAIARLEAIDNVGKPHIAGELVRMGLEDTISDAIAHYLKKCDAGCDPKLFAGKAIEAILAAGGTPVWAHPMGGENERHLSREEVEENLLVMLPYGLKGMECHYSRYTKEEEALLLSIADHYQLLVSAGSDYHGKTKTVALGCLCADPGQVYLEKETGVVWEILSKQRSSISGKTISMDTISF